MVGTALQTIVAQRLVRRVCGRSREPSPPRPDGLQHSDYFNQLWRTRAASSLTNSSFHEPHADGPVASESASVNAWSRSSRSQMSALDSRLN